MSRFEMHRGERCFWNHEDCAYWGLDRVQCRAYYNRLAAYYLRMAHREFDELVKQDKRTDRVARFLVLFVIAALIFGVVFL